jgi:hypothetical protein
MNGKITPHDVVTCISLFIITKLRIFTAYNPGHYFLREFECMLDNAASRLAILDESKELRWVTVGIRFSISTTGLHFDIRKWRSNIW